MASARRRKSSDWASRARCPALIARPGDEKKRSGTGSGEERKVTPPELVRQRRSFGSIWTVIQFDRAVPSHSNFIASSSDWSIGLSGCARTDTSRLAVYLSLTL